VIVTQPSPVVTGIGGSATFSVAASGAPTLSYQWLKNGSAIPGATGSSLTFNSVTAGDAASYSVRVTNPFGPTTSTAVALTIAPLPTIVAVLVNPNPPLLGRALRMEVTAAGTGPITYQWQLNNSDIPGATSPILERASAEAGTFTLKVTGPGGTLRRDVATVLAQYILSLTTVRGGSVSVTPSQAAYTAGTRVTLTPRADPGYAFAGWTDDASGTDNPLSLTMDGHKSITPLFGATGGTVNFVNRITGTLDAPVFDTDGVTKLDDRYVAALYGGTSASTLAQAGPPIAFRSGVGVGYFPGEERSIASVPPGATAFVQVKAWRLADGPTHEAAVAAGAKAGESRVFSVTTGNFGSPPSLPSVLIGLQSFQLQTATPPRIVTQPVPVITGLGGTARFEVVAAGSPPLAYQWRKGGSAIPGAITPGVRDRHGDRHRRRLLHGLGVQRPRQHGERRSRPHHRPAARHLRRDGQPEPTPVRSPAPTRRHRRRHRALHLPVAPRQLPDPRRDDRHPQRRRRGTRHVLGPGHRPRRRHDPRRHHGGRPIHADPRRRPRRHAHRHPFPGHLRLRIPGQSLRPGRARVRLRRLVRRPVRNHHPGHPRHGRP
jgi:uncharacterized repeat protein (TIGR02543 family)